MENTLQELKIALEWSVRELEVAKGSRISDVDRYNKAKELYEKVKKEFDHQCLQLINNIKTNKTNKNEH